MAQVYDPAGVRLFSFFSFDAGRICGKRSMLTDKVTPNPDIDGELYTFRPVVRTDKTVDFSALSRDELAKLQNDERRARAELLALKVEQLGLIDADDDDENDDDTLPDLCSLLPEPIYSAKAIMQQRQLLGGVENDEKE